MNLNPYSEKLEKLQKNEITELIVERVDFLLFREAWLEHPEKMNFVGEAGLNGRIIYRYVKEQKKEKESS